MRIPTRVSRELLAALNHTAATTGSSRNAIVARVVEKAGARFPEDARGRRAFRQRLAAQRARGTPTETLSIELPDETARTLRELGGRGAKLRPSALLRVLLALEYLPVEVATPASLRRRSISSGLLPLAASVRRGSTDARVAAAAPAVVRPTRAPSMITSARSFAPGRNQVLNSARPLSKRMLRPAPVVPEASGQRQVVNSAVQLIPYLSPDGRAKVGPMLAAAGVAVPDTIFLLQLSSPRARPGRATICPACVPHGGADGVLQACPGHEEQALRLLWDRARGR